MIKSIILQYLLHNIAAGKASEVNCKIDTFF